MWLRFGFILAWFLVTAVKCQLTPCKTPNGEAASCVPLLRCVVLIQAAASNESTALKFLNESACDENTCMVCCGTAGNYTKTVTTAQPLAQKEMFDGLSKEQKRNYVLTHLLPTKKFCGMQHTDDYFYNSTETSVDEFPWLVYVIARNTVYGGQYYATRSENNLAGALISKQYVISTKSLAVIGRESTSTDSINMVLGLHHIQKRVNCIPTPFGIDDCTDPSLHISSSHWKQYEDIMLLRLDKKIDYSDFIRPICLPLQADEIPTAGSLVMASGWGEEEFVKDKRLKVKKRMKYTVISKEDCQTNNPQSNSLCGLPLETNTHFICNSDIGGPLMYRHKDRNWFAVGLIFQSANLCDEVQPLNAKQMTPDIINWIIATMEP